MSAAVILATLLPMMLVLGCGLVTGEPPRIHNVNQIAFKGPELSVTTLNLLFADPLGGDGEEAGETLSARFDIVAQALIADRPDIIALQEVSITRSHGDILRRLVEQLNEALAPEGISYNWVYSGAHSDPTGLNGFEEGEGLLSRYEIVAARDLVYEVQGPIFSLLGAPLLLESRQALQVTLRGQDGDIDVVTTHLFPGRGAVNDEQVAELLRALARSNEARMTILLGDLNVTPNSPAIARLRKAGFIDAWRAAHPNGPPGWTHPHKPLSSREATAQERIDYIFVRGGSVRGATMFLDRAIPLPSVSESDRWLWASDHSGLSATVAPADSGRTGH